MKLGRSQRFKEAMQIDASVKEIIFLCLSCFLLCLNRTGPAIANQPVEPQSFHPDFLL